MGKHTGKWIVPLGVELLEDRCLLSGTAPWPVTLPAGQTNDVVNSYGQFVTSGGLELHGADDIVAPAGTKVMAVEAGKVVGVDAANADVSKRFVSVGSNDGSHGWDYFHVDPAVNPATGAVWVVGNAVNVGDVLGTVAAQGAASIYPSHVHLAYGTQLDPRLAPLTAPGGDPLTYLVSQKDTTKPTIVGVGFEAGADNNVNGTLAGGILLADGNTILQYETPTTSHHYWAQKNAKGQVIVGGIIAPIDALGNKGASTSSVDVISQAYDQLFATGDKIGVKTIAFNATGKSKGATTGKVTTFDFSGQFATMSDTSLPGPPRPQDYETLQTTQIVRTVYEHDSQSQSQDKTNYYYVVTNTDSDTLVDPGDRARYWATTAVKGSQWNDTKAALGTNDATSNFPDDIYTITITASDEAGNVGTFSQQIVLVNWLRTIFGSGFADANGTTEDIQITGGANYSANQAVPLYFYAWQPGNPSPITDGMTLGPGAAFTATVHTDADGNINPQDIGHVLIGNAGGFYCYADYDQDGVFTSYLDASVLILLQQTAQSPVRHAAAVHPTKSTPDLDLPIDFVSGTLPKKLGLASDAPLMSPIENSPIPGGLSPTVLDAKKAMAVAQFFGVHDSQVTWDGWALASLDNLATTAWAKE